MRVFDKKDAILKVTLFIANVANWQSIIASSRLQFCQWNDSSRMVKKEFHLSRIS
jgi:hypothetical protein